MTKRTKPTSGKTPRARTSRRRLLARLWPAQGGVTAIEMAFLMPVFLMFLLGIVEFGRALWTQTSLQFAVEAAARYAALGCPGSAGGCSTNALVQNYAASQAFGLTISDPTKVFIYTPNATCGVSSLSGTGGAKVTATYQFKPIVDKLVPLDVTLNAKSCHP